MDDTPSPRDLTGTWATGRQWRLRHDHQTAQVAQCGAALRGYRVAGSWLTEPVGPDAPPPAGNGQLLVPWPNRIRDGRWLLDGVPQQLPLTEPARGNASHGLLRHAAYQPLEESGQHVQLAAEIYPVTGYPFRLTHTVTYALDDAGLRVAHALAHHDTGSGPAPVAIGAHPYLRVGDVPVADCTLRVPADTAILTDERLLPVGTEPVSGDHDWRDGPLIGGRRVDTGYGVLTLADDGVVRHELRAPDGRGVDLWADPAFGFVQLFTTDRLPGRDLAVAVEPMTAPADAFNSGTGLVWLEPGASWTVSWGLSPVGFDDPGAVRADVLA